MTPPRKGRRKKLIKCQVPVTSKDEMSANMVALGVSTVDPDSARDSLTPRSRYVHGKARRYVSVGLFPAVYERFYAWCRRHNLSLVNGTAKIAETYLK